MYIPSLEYFAGFFDGEGCLQMRKRPSGTHRLTISINCTHLPTLEHFKNRFDGEVRTVTTGTNKQMHQWALNKISDCLVFLKQVEPFLIEKSEQAALAVQWLEHRQRFPLKSVKARYDMNFADDITQKIKDLKHMEY